MTRLFKRRVAVTVARFRLDSFFTPESNATVIRDFRIAFSVQKSLTSQPNTCEIVINNLSERTRAAFQEKPLHIRLDVGFDDQEDRIFTGDLIWASSRHENVDWETRLQVGDGSRAYKHARVRRSFKAGANVRDVLSETVKSMGLSVPTSVAEARNLFGKFSSGVTLEGPSQRELTRILRSRGLDWSVQDGKLQVLEPNGVRKDQAVIISKDTGMIGSPESGPPTDPGKPAIVVVSTSLDARVVPGVRLQLQTRQFNGPYRAERVTHTGDTDGTDWLTKVEARPI